MKYVGLIFIACFFAGCALFSTSGSKEAAQLQPQQAEFIAQDIVSFVKEIYGPGQTPLLFASTSGVFSQQLENTFRHAGYALYGDKKIAPNNAEYTLYIIDRLSPDEIRVGLQVGKYQINRLYQLQNNTVMAATGFTLNTME